MKIEKAKSHEDLIVWQEAHKLVIEVYGATNSFPSHEIQGLAADLRRISIGIPKTIADGFKQPSNEEKINYFQYTYAAIEDCRYYLILARDLSYLPTENFDTVVNQLSNTRKLLQAYLSSLRFSNN